MLAVPLLNLPPWFSPPDWGKTIVFRSILAALILLFTYQIVASEDKQKIAEIKALWIKKDNNLFWPVWLISAFFLVLFLSAIFSLDRGFSFWGSPYRSGGFVNFGATIIFSIFVFLFLKAKDWPKIWNFAFLIGGIVAIIAVLQQLGITFGILVPVITRPQSTIGGPIFLGIYLLLLLFLLIAFLVREKSFLKKSAYFILFLLYLFVIILTGARAVFIGLLAGALFFLFFYPRKSRLLLLLKIFLLSSILFVAVSTYYVNVFSNAVFHSPYVLKNQTVASFLERFQIKLLAEDPRFQSWKMVLPALFDRPILGYGQENFSIAFDKYYQASLPNLSKEEGSWWDRAHNNFLELGITNGIPALIIYLAIFGVIIFQLQRLKKNKTGADLLLLHSLQTAFIAYLVANFFAFDTFSSWLISFLLIGYSLYLITREAAPQTTEPRPVIKLKWGHLAAFAFPLFAVIYFIWTYNIRPFQINTQINMARSMVEERKNCPSAFIKMEKLFPQKSILDQYVRLKEVDFIRVCEAPTPEAAVVYAQGAIELLKENVKIRPYYTRFWIFLGAFTNVLIEKSDEKIKPDLTKEANSYFEAAEKLSPGHQEIYIEWAKTDMVSGDYPKMKEKTDKCVSLNPRLSDCYWFKGIAEIYLHQPQEARTDLEEAKKKGYNTNALLSLHQLVKAYSATLDFANLIPVYEKLIEIKPEEFRYYASLAFIHYQLENYDEAREIALKVLELAGDNQELKEETERFLESLPKK